MSQSISCILSWLKTVGSYKQVPHIQIKRESNTRSPGLRHRKSLMEITQCTSTLVYATEKAQQKQQKTAIKSNPHSQAYSQLSKKDQHSKNQKWQSETGSLLCYSPVAKLMIFSTLYSIPLTSCSVATNIKQYTP